MSRTPDEVPIRLNPRTVKPTAVFAPCGVCRRSKSDYLGLIEAFDLYGYARTSCVACRLTDHRRVPPIDAADRTPLDEPQR